MRESGFRDHWRFFALLVLLSYFTAWAGTRAVMAGLEDTWTAIALPATRHENQALRVQQETLREQTEATLDRLEALETTYARAP